MKRIFVAVAILILYPSIAIAENYRFDGLYEMSASKDWQVVSSSHAAELMKQAEKKADKIKIEFDVDLKDISTPFMIYRGVSSGAFSTRVMVGPPELTKKEFDRLTISDINTLGTEILKRQNEIMKASGIRQLSSQSGMGKFKGVSAVQIESVYFNTRGLKVSQTQYIVYRASATLIITLAHTVLSGEPNYKLIENEITSFNVLAQ